MNFKKTLALVLSLACIFLMLVSCAKPQNNDPLPTDNENVDESQTNDTPVDDAEPTPDEEEEQIITPDVTLNNLGEDLAKTGINNGKFEGETTSSDFKVTYISGTEGAYSYDDSKKLLTFTSLSADSVYSISGKLNGSIAINVGAEYKLELEMAGISIRSATANPIWVNSAKEVQITAKKDTKSYVYDERAAIDSNDSKLYSGAIYSTAPLTLCGNGELFVQSVNNNGIQSDSDLTVKSIPLVVECNDKALNGKSTVTLENCSTLLIAKSGDAIKTESSDISKASAQHNGTVKILGGTHNIFASNDGIDASYDVVVDYGSYLDESTNKTLIVDTILNVYTDKYSSYTAPTAHDKPEVETRALYICNSSEEYKYSVKLMNADESKSEWVNPAFYESFKNRNRTYYTYKFYVKPEYTKMQVFVYTKDQDQQNEEKYDIKSNLVDIKSDSDTYRYSSKRWEWKTYSSLTQSGNNGTKNPDAVSYSAKGVKGTNSVLIKAGAITIKSTDNAISANNQTILDSGKSPVGELTIVGGNLTVNTKCNGLYSDNAITVADGIVKILEAFDGVNADTINVTGGDISILSTNNGFNSKLKTGTGITIEGGNIYVQSSSYGIYASSTSSYAAISFKGGNIVIIAPEANKSAIYSGGGYTYTDGKILAILNKEGNRTSSTKFYDFSRTGKIQDLELTEGAFVTVQSNGDILVSAKIAKAFSATAIYLGDRSTEISAEETIDAELNSNGVYWAE